MGTSILDLPKEIHLVIGQFLHLKSIYSCIHVCRSFYSAFIPYLWSGICPINPKDRTIMTSSTHVRANAHHIKYFTIFPTLTEEFYHLVFPRLRKLCMRAYLGDFRNENYFVVKPSLKVHFMLSHPFVRKLVYLHNDVLPKEFWDIVGTQWSRLETLKFAGIVKADALDAFWKVCGQVQNLRLVDANIPGSAPTPLTLSFQRLKSLKIERLRSTSRDFSYQNWSLPLLEQVKAAQGLQYLKWTIQDVPFPAQMVQEALAKGCWPELCKLSLDDSSCPDHVLANVLRSFTSQRLTDFEHGYIFGSSTYKSLQEQHFGHLQQLKIGYSKDVTSAMVQEVLMECVHLVTIHAPFVYLEDIVTAPKPWSCLKLEHLDVFIAKEKGDKAAWSGQVMDQISKLRRLRYLSLERPLDEDLNVIFKDSETLDLRMKVTISQSTSRDSCRSNDNETDEGGSDISCWSSLVQLREISFDGDQQMLGMNEALWMIEHWRDVEHVNGEFRGVEGDDVEKLNQLWRESHIDYYY